MTRIVAAGLVLLLAGCAAMPPADLEPPPADWRLVGRLALSNGRDGGSGQLEWDHRGDTERLRFVGALGRGSWRLAANPAGARLTLANGQVLEAADVETLVRRELDWEIPVRALSYWVAGVPAPTSRPATRRDAAGRLELLEQNGWRVRYEGYLDVGGVAMPRKMTAERDGNRVRLIVSSWELQPGP